MDNVRPLSDWIPMSLKEASKRNWDEFDVILISGDAYVDGKRVSNAVFSAMIVDK